MADRVCLFVDGENFRYSINDLFPNFQRSDYLPKSADWTALFDWIVSEATEDGIRLRTYWYVSQSINFSPYRFPDVKDETESLRRLLNNHQPIKTRLDSLEGDDLEREMTTILGELTRHRDWWLRNFEGQTIVQDGISRRHKAIEFRRAGEITFDLFEGRFRQEKAVDVKLASDLIVLRDIYDVAIILSGDQDFVPAVEIVKDFGKRVVKHCIPNTGWQAAARRS